jgi:hypothetical protein
LDTWADLLHAAGVRNLKGPRFSGAPWHVTISAVPPPQRRALFHEWTAGAQPAFEPYVVASSGQWTHLGPARIPRATRTIVGTAPRTIVGTAPRTLVAKEKPRTTTSQQPAHAPAASVLLLETFRLRPGPKKPVEREGPAVILFRERGGEWTDPGGVLDGRQDPVATAQRELAEESRGLFRITITSTWMCARRCRFPCRSRGGKRTA